MEVSLSEKKKGLEHITKISKGNAFTFHIAVWQFVSLKGFSQKLKSASIHSFPAIQYFDSSIVVVCAVIRKCSFYSLPLLLLEQWRDDGKWQGSSIALFQGLDYLDQNTQAILQKEKRFNNPYIYWSKMVIW